MAEEEDDNDVVIAGTKSYAQFDVMNMKNGNHNPFNDVEDLSRFTGTTVDCSPSVCRYV